MIHLHRLIKELRRLLISKRDTNSIRSKTDEIIQACNRLISEHAQNREVTSYLEMIRMAANRMGRATYGGMAMGASGPFNYDIAIGDLEAMEKRIAQVGTILKIEFKEIES